MKAPALPIMSRIRKPRSRDTQDSSGHALSSGQRAQRGRRRRRIATAASLLLAAPLTFGVGACAAAGDADEAPSGNFGDAGTTGGGAAGAGGDGTSGGTNAGGTNAGGASSGGEGGFAVAGAANGGAAATGGANTGEALATLKGRVLAPEGTIPISGALVYVTHNSVPAIPQKVYCDSCVELAAGTSYAITAADGTFSLPVSALGEWKLVVRKGAFRRVRTFNIEAEGDVQVGEDLTTLPEKRDAAAGDDIPKMAVAITDVGLWDEIANTLGKLGLGEVDGYGRLLDGSASFDIYSDASPGAGAPSLLTDYDVLSQYHVVYFPCTEGWHDDYLKQPAVIENLRRFMTEGGRIYATDYSYDVLKRAFPDPLQWLHDDGSFGSAQTSVYDAPAQVADQGLKDWLLAQGISDFTLEANYTVLDGVSGYSAPNEEGNVTNMSPTVWVNADVPGEGIHPATVSYQYGCGRALFSTYHTEPSALSTPMAQERALLYVILEVAVCIGDYPPPK
jgi:hypothetical protein